LAQTQKHFVCCECHTGNKPSEMRAFAELALWRRCLYVVVHRGTVLSDGDLAKAIGLSAPLATIPYRTLRLVSNPRPVSFLHVVAGISLYTARRMNARLEQEGVAAPRPSVKGPGKGKREATLEMVSSASTELVFNAYFNGKMVATAPPPHLLKPAVAPAVPAAPAAILAPLTAPAPVSTPPAPVNMPPAESAEQQVPAMAISDSVARMALDEQERAEDRPVVTPVTPHRGLVRGPFPDRPCPP
jgi:hypothetical protein